jgi:phage terminase large subunit-like protein
LASSRSGALLGSQEPRVLSVPASRRSDGEDAVDLASTFGLVPHPWQALVLGAWLGRRADGKWSAGRCGLAVPRQNGKNGAIEVRELYGMVALGEKFLHTAHEVKTARKAFKRLQHFFGEKAGDPAAEYPDLNALVTEVRATNGQEAIYLANGGSVEFVARSRGSGRGYTVDVLVMDEAQELTDEQLEALQSTISAAPSANPQTILTGTPPGPTAPGEVFTRVRSGGVSGKNRRLAWHEWSLDGVVDVQDPANWCSTNPSLGLPFGLQRSVILDELPPDGLSVEGFMRERLGMWSDDASGAVIPGAAWDALADVSEEPAPHLGKVVLAVDTDPERRRTSIVAAGIRDDGLPMVELVENLPGVDWAVEAVKDIHADGGVSAVVVDKRSAAASLIQALADAKITVVGTSAGEMVQACGQFYDAAVETGHLRHIDQPELNYALKGSIKRELGDAWAWDRKKTTDDITPITAATLALWGFTNKVGIKKTPAEAGSSSC